MTDKALKLLGLMRPAGAIEIGADRAAEAAAAGKARVLILASDISESAARKAAHALEGKSALKLELPFTREELSDALGVGDCTMAAITDIGFAEAFARELAAEDAGRFAEYKKKKLEGMQEFDGVSVKDTYNIAKNWRKG